MAQKRLYRTHRYCEECGQPFESQRSDVHLCPQCFRSRKRQKALARKRQQAKRQIRALDIEFDEQ